MDIDVEAMLDAPYQEKKNESSHKEHSHSDREHKDVDRRERDYRDYKDYRDDERRSSRHSDRYYSSHSRSRRRSSRSRRSSRHRSPSPHSSRRHYRSTRSISRERRRRSSPVREYRRPSVSKTRESKSPSQRKRTRSPSLGNGGRSPSPTVPEADRDRRTVFVTQLAARLTTREFEAFFAQAGRLREAKIIMDRNSRKSKGVGYVEYYEEASVQNALALSGQKLLGIPVLVSLSEAEKNRLALQAQNNIQQIAAGEPTYQRLYVGSIHFSLTDDDIRQIFEPFGPLDFVNLHKDLETGRSKGFGFIQYKNATDAKQALEKMNGFELAGRNIKVGLVSNTRMSTGGDNSGFKLDDEETEGVALNSLSRAELMAKLAARDSNAEYVPPKNILSSATPPKLFIPAATSRFVMLNNMFNPAEETEPGWVTDLELDIKLESERYGSVEYIKVVPDSMGEVFLKFDSSTSATEAIKALNGRWFGGKQITASYIPEAIFNANAL